MYLRFSNDIEKDINRGYSMHYSGMGRDFTPQQVADAFGVDVSDIEYNEEAREYVQVLPGLCAFELEADNLEDAIEEAKSFYYNDVYNAESMRNWHILSGKYVGDCPEGDCIDVDKVIYSNNN